MSDRFTTIYERINSCPKKTQHHSKENMDACDGIRQLMDMNSKRRDKILEVYQDIENVLQMDDDFCRVVNTDFDRITKDLDKLGSKVRSPECPILIAGETSAGKSTLINLLIGRSILPMKLLKCTSTICKIWNSEGREIIFTNMHDEKEVHVFDMDDYEDKMKVLLTDNVVKGSANNKWKYVDIYLPVPLLENNITIVDSPGIQEDDNTTLMECLFDYLPNAIAFIYVIDSGRAGGVENDQWLKKILLKITEQQERGFMLHFQAETTLFVCNKWDQVNEKEEHEVTNFIVHQLRSIWPNLNPDKQLFKLSCKKENKRNLKNSLPTQNYTNLVEGISKMMSIILEAKMLMHVRWQRHVVHKMIERIASIIVTSKQTNDERERRVKEVEHRLSLLANKLKQVKQSALDKVDEKCKVISKTIVNHLRTSKRKMLSEMFNLMVNSDRSTYTIDSIHTIIENEIMSWCTQNKDDVNNEIENMIKKELFILEEDIGMQDGIFGSIDACQSQYGPKVMSCCAMFGLSPITSCVFMGSLFIPVLQIFSMIRLLNFTPDLLPIKVLEFQDMRVETVESLNQFADNILENYVTEKYIFNRIKPFRNHAKDKVTYICEIDVPRKITADKIFLGNALKQRSALKDIMRQYRPIQFKCEMLLGKIEILLVEYFPECKLSFLYINDAKFQHQIGKGSFAIVQSAIVSINNEERVVAVKTLTTALDGMYSYTQLSEALILSKLNNRQQNIMKMYGISISKSAGQKFLQIYMEYCEDSLFNIVMKKRKPRACGNFENVGDCKDSWKFVTDIMQGLCSALDYVHRSGLVHRDLKLDNILVKEGNSVRLADFGLSKNEENITGTVAGTPLYMAPEVMMGDLYGSEADIYSLGMVLYELWYYRPVFTRPLQSNPSKYEFTVQTRKDLEDKVLKGCRPDCEIPLKPPVELKAVMETCWDANREKRPTALEVYNRLTKVQFN